ncbi:MAG: 16S rRNA (cytosine(1402)-N(4))-methyltransferase, partial [Patescibacteria group bacterium]
MHTPVLLKEVIELLDIHEGDIYLDATVGEGGHALEIKKRCGSKVEIVGIDADPRAIERIREKFKEGKFEVLNFREI